MSEPNGRDWLVDQYGERAVMDIERVTLDAARLSHDRGADAEKVDAAWDALGQDLYLVSIPTALDKHRPLIEAALSVPAPTLPAYRCLKCGRNENGCECEGGGDMVPAPTLPALADAVDAAWHDEGDHIEYHAELPERLLALREALRDAV